MQTPPYTPERKFKGLTRNRSDSRSKRSRASSVVSSTSEDGAVFLGKAPPRALTPRPRQRRPEPIHDTEQSVVTSEEDTMPQSPIERLVFWIEDQWTRTQRDENEFLRQLVFFLFISLIFVTVRSHNAECPPQTSGVVVRENGGDAAWSAVHRNLWPMVDRDAILSPATPSSGDITSPPWSPAQSKPSIPLYTDMATPHSGTSAFAVWNFIPAAPTNLLQPSKLKEGAKTLLHPVNIASAVWSFAQRQFFNWSWTTATSTFTPVREPDIHGWNIVIANQERRQYFLSVLRDMEEVSSHLHVGLSSQLFESAEQMSAIESYQELQMQLTELRTRQREIVRLLAIYHKASTLASTALDDYILAGHPPTNLNSLRSSILNTGSQLLTRLNAARENIDSVTRVVEGLPWKVQKDKWWLGRWIDQFRYRGIVAAVEGLEHLGVYVDTVCGMVTSDLQALR